MNNDPVIRRFADFLEKANKAFWYTVVFPVLFRRPVAATQPMQLPERILVIRSDAIGDMILTTPLFRALKTRNPSLKIWVAASAENAQVIAADPDIERNHILNGKGCRSMGRHPCPPFVQAGCHHELHHG